MYGMHPQGVTNRFHTCQDQIDPMYPWPGAQWALAASPWLTVNMAHLFGSPALLWSYSCYPWFCLYLLYTCCFKWLIVTMQHHMVFSSAKVLTFVSRLEDSDSTVVSYEYSNFQLLKLSLRASSHWTSLPLMFWQYYEIHILYSAGEREESVAHNYYDLNFGIHN